MVSHKLYASARGAIDSEKKFDELLNFIRGKGKGVLGKGITSYPNGDENNKLIHSGCLALEKRGLIFRQSDEDDYVLWMPVEE